MSDPPSRGSAADRLSLQTLGRVPPAIVTPAYDIEKHGVGLLHLGIGAFHRAHQAVYTDDVLGSEGGDWRSVGVSLRSRTVADQLNPQNGLYAVSVNSAEASVLRVIGSVESVLYAPENPARVVARLCDPAIRVVTLTITEKGYCHDPSTGYLNVDNPAIAADLTRPDRPQSAPGYLLAGLRARRSSGIPPFTVLSCDNLPDNGRLLHRLLVQLAAYHDKEFSNWIEERVACPATMIDRIVPATTAADREAAAQRLGVLDKGLVITEPFTQWVIEDRFCAGRPRWELAGAQLVADVGPYEHAKLRLLNGCHSTIAYLGYLAGYSYVHEAMRDATLRRFVTRLMAGEIEPTLNVPADLDLDRYRRDLLARFENPALNHRTYQIAMDGSQKLPQRLLGTIRDRLRADAPIDGLSLAIAGWIRYVYGRDEHDTAIHVQDPLSDELQSAAAGLLDEPADALRNVLAIRKIFDDDLRSDPRFAESVLRALRRLIEYGARQSLAATLEEMTERR